MTAMIMHSPSLSVPALGRRFWKNSLAAGLAVALHAGVVALLVLGWSVEKPAAEAPRVLRTQLVMLPAAPVPEAPASVIPVAQPALESTPPPLEAPRPAPTQPLVDPRVQAQKLEQAALARKRVEEQKREQQAQQQRERQESERRRQDTEQQAAEQQRQARQAQALAEQRQAEQARQAAADSRSYQPLSKQAPDYPQRALDKGLEGDCTVEYSVTPDGRIDNPKVIDGCHPLFIRPSLAAAQTFRYQPRIIDGKAVTVPAVRNTFHYRIK
ncbi:IgA-specific serine endopeptidase autotransporter precursor [Pseudomonas ogarae]|uniref:energy transducer TonB n=1 Tax=Pseudomonas ogarae (strain DSM 112162 / CECT 30235 / F113) TaxID=1114970 RepID=UPI000BB388CA|nr:MULTISPECIES: energy transducer TonB [Pseudomonas]PBJ10322.1 IgA-specific serine endopeptidase autotransporter precursor [Pseudomonas ogarae]PBJ22702.1 IgA-specific serine endopeptidase autotransporter precursor [Pseudomonas ogarae]QXH92375.1 TonB family protein [Pseudomonas zarinae]